jgi:hypothetical protein
MGGGTERDGREPATHVLPIGSAKSCHAPGDSFVLQGLVVPCRFL